MTPPGTEAQPQATSDLPASPSSVSFENIPLSMRGVSRWVLWKYEERDGKKTKVPYSDGSVRVKSNDPTTWKRFDEVMKLLPFFPGYVIGFQLGDGWTGIDIAFQDLGKEHIESTHFDWV